MTDYDMSYTVILLLGNAKVKCAIKRHRAGRAFADSQKQNPRKNNAWQKSWSHGP
jgi:hypothetical protein